ncbi:MAG: hypothetical protein QMD97_00685 [Candidatus Aenigmarchaeota archaeon]|nr:hypothetical protein [Candidatus Aenigmarchaeota archaeon]
MRYYCHCSSPTTIEDTNLQLYSLEQAARNWNELAALIKENDEVNSIPHCRERIFFILCCFSLSLIQLLGQNSPYKRKRVDDPIPLLHAVLNDCNVERDIKKRLGKTFDSFIEYYDAVRHFGESIGEKKYQIVDKLTLRELDKFRIMTIEIWDIIIAKYKKDEKNDLNEIRSVTDLVDFEDMPCIKKEKNGEFIP